MTESFFHMQNRVVGMCNEAKLNLIVLSDQTRADHKITLAR
jgi:hypothetical protein